MTKIKATSAILLVSVMLSAGNCPAYDLDDEYCRELKDLYAFTNWFGKTQTNYVHLAANWVPDLAALSITNIVGGDVNPTTREMIPTTNEDGTVETEVIFKVPNDPSIEVDVMTCQELSVPNAQEHVLGVFAGCTRHPFIEGKGNGADIGDRCYLGAGTNMTFVCFVRNNIFVRVQAMPRGNTYSHPFTSYSVVGIARGLDEQIRKISVGHKEGILMSFNVGGMMCFLFGLCFTLAGYGVIKCGSDSIDDPIKGERLEGFRKLCRWAGPLLMIAGVIILFTSGTK